MTLGLLKHPEVGALRSRATPCRAQPNHNLAVEHREMEPGDTNGIIVTETVSGRCAGSIIVDEALDPESDDTRPIETSRGRRIPEERHAVSRTVESQSRSSRTRAHKRNRRSRHGDHSSSEEEDPDEVDVLRRHQERNGVPRPPSQEALRASQQCRQRSSRVRDSRSDDDAQGSVREKKAEKRNFWPSMWKLLIDEAKVEWRLYLSVGDAFPNPTQVKDSAINDIVQQMFQHFKRKGRQLDDGYFPRYRYELSTLVRCIIQAYPR